LNKLILLLLITPLFGFSQGEQRYADGTATDQDGNTFEWINYGDLDWAIENARVLTYRDGTPIPQVIDANEWLNNYLGARCTDLNGYIFYNWYVHSRIAPIGWRVAYSDDWYNLENYLIANGYNYDGTTTGNKIAKAMASTTGWENSEELGAVGNDQKLNNKSGLNLFPLGYMDLSYTIEFGHPYLVFTSQHLLAVYWESYSKARLIGLNTNFLASQENFPPNFGAQFRFVRDPYSAFLGEQRYTDGTSNDQDGNTFEWINYGTQDWAIENTEVVTYRDGTPIPQVTDATEWSNLTTGAWCYYNNDPTKGKLYNWYAVAGIHDNDPNTSNKVFAPDGWRVPTDLELKVLKQFLIENGYNYNGTLGKNMASTSGWNSYSINETVGKNQDLNNVGGFNAFPVGNRGASVVTSGEYYDIFYGEGESTTFWLFNEEHPNFAYSFGLSFDNSILFNFPGGINKKCGFSVRLIRDASTASTKDYSDAITIYPNPTSSIINIEQDFTTAKVYEISGKELLKTTSKTIDLSELPSNIYLLRLYDSNNRILGTGKIIKN
jgi:uncharacterized protein (TIGR02145 family)